MKTILRILITAALATVSFGARADDLMITGATLIDGTGREPVANAAIHIRDGRIVAAGPRSSVKAPAKAKAIDAKGKYVIPGLMDANIHLVLDIRPETMIRYEGRYEDLVEEGAQIALKAGLTTVFDSWGPRQPLVNVRNKINAGQIPGSRIYLAGNIVGISSPIGGDFATGRANNIGAGFHKYLESVWVEGTGPDLMWQGPEEVRKVIRGYLAKDIDFLKYLASGHLDMKTLTFSPHVQQVMIEETHRAGKIIQTHTTTVESLDMVIGLGVDMLQHCDITGPTVPIPPETLKLLADKQIPCATLAYTNRRIEWAKANSAPGTEWTDVVTMKDTNLRNLIKTGANILLSTDAGVFSQEFYDVQVFGGGFSMSHVDDPLQIGEGHFNWLKSVSERDMKPMDALRAATIKIAEAYKVDKDVGTLEPGKRADLLILDKDPLSAAENYRSIHTILKDGKVVDRGALPLRPMLTAGSTPPARGN